MEPNRISNFRVTPNQTRGANSLSHLNKTKEEKSPEIQPQDQFTPSQDLPPGLSPDEVKYFSKGNDVKVYWNNEAIAREMELIANAKKYIRVERYEFEDLYPAILLAKKAKEGVKVQVIIDPTSSNWDSFKWQQKQYIIDFLKKSGVDVKLYPVKEVTHSSATASPSSKELTQGLMEPWKQKKEYQELQ